MDNWKIVNDDVMGGRQSDFQMNNEGYVNLVVLFLWKITVDLPRKEIVCMRQI